MRYQKALLQLFISIMQSVICILIKAKCRAGALSKVCLNQRDYCHHFFLKQKDKENHNSTHKLNTHTKIHILIKTEKKEL